MDRYFWKGYYHDGSTITEGDENPSTGRLFSSDHLDPTRLKALVLEPKRAGITRVIVKSNPGDKIRRKWRHYVSSTGAHGTCHMISVERNGQSFHTFIKPDGKMVVSTNSEGSECNISQKVYVDCPADGSHCEDVIDLGNGTNCAQVRLNHGGESYFTFFMNDGSIIISTDDQGYLFSL